jgi:putative oxidoreductase
VYPCMYTTYPMNQLAKLGRPLFAIGIAFFGLQYLIYGQFLGGLPPVPPWSPGGRIAAYGLGVFLVAAGLSILLNRYRRFAAIALAALFLLCVIFLHTQRMHDVVYNGVDRTRVLEPLSLAGAALVLAAASRAVTLMGKIVFALTMLVFGAQHSCMRLSSPL